MILSETESTLHEVMLALKQTEPLEVAECGFCRLEGRSVARSIKTLAAEFVNDPQTRVNLRESRGFCPEHSRLIIEHLDPVAVSILYADLAEVTWELWAGKQPVSASRRLFSSARKPSCPPCITARETSERSCAALASQLSQPEIWSAVEANRWICVSHSEQIRKLARPADAERLRILETNHLKSLRAELEEIVRKNDYRFKGESWGPEKDAWIRAVKKLQRPNS